MASASIRPAPVWEALYALRSGARAITGAVSGVLIVASWSLSPRTPQWPNAAPCSAYPCTSRMGVIEVDERDPIRCVDFPTPNAH
jgi:hypothetical protein